MIHVMIRRARDAARDAAGDAAGVAAQAACVRGASRLGGGPMWARSALAPPLAPPTWGSSVTGWRGRRVSERLRLLELEEQVGWADGTCGRARAGAVKLRERGTNMLVWNLACPVWRE